MIDVDQATTAALRFVAESHRPEDVRGLRCDERVWDHDGCLWRITVSFFPQDFPGEPSTASKRCDVLARTYMWVLVEPYAGTALYCIDHGVGFARRGRAHIDDTQAAQAAKAYLKAHHPPEETAGLKVEQALWVHVSEIWKITLSLAPPKAHGNGVRKAGKAPLSRTYKALLIDPYDAGVLLLQDIHYSLPRGD